MRLSSLDGAWLRVNAVVVPSPVKVSTLSVEVTSVVMSSNKAATTLNSALSPELKACAVVLSCPLTTVSVLPLLAVTLTISLLVVSSKVT